MDFHVFYSMNSQGCLKVVPLISIVSLPSPHVVKYYGSYFKNTDLWIVMEYCGAGSVSDIIRLRNKTVSLPSGIMQLCWVLTLSSFLCPVFMHTLLLMYLDRWLLHLPLSMVLSPLCFLMSTKCGSFNTNQPSPVKWFTCFLLGEK